MSTSQTDVTRNVQVVAHGRASVLIDMQYGSTGKGLFAAFLAHQPDNAVDIASTNAGPNAGHTTCYAPTSEFPQGRKFVAFHLPTFGIIQQSSLVYLNAGSVIDPDMLFKEMEEMGVSPKRLAISPRAVVVTPEDKAYEQDPTSGAAKLASTQKGIGRAIARKVMREATVAGEHPQLKEFTKNIDVPGRLRRGQKMMIEVPQGFDLSLNDGLSYPHCTSRSINVAQALSDAGVHPSVLYKTIGTQRYMPIRVGNLKDADGKEIGFSGPCYPDQKEITWAEAGQEPEFTTVTKRMRRVFTWSATQYARALEILQPDLVFCNFLNYAKSSQGGGNWGREMEALERQRFGRVIDKLYGVGPCVEDVGTKLECFKKMGWM